MDDLLPPLDALIVRLETELSRLDDAALDRAPADGGWNARQALTHVQRTVDQYNDQLARLVAKHEGRPQKGGDHRPSWVGRLLLSVLRKPGKRVKAPGTFRPDEHTEAFDRGDLVASHQRLRSLAEQIDALGLASRRIGTPVTRLLRLSAREAVEINTMHGERHLAQALRAAGLAPAE